MELLWQGAEASVYLVTHEGKQAVKKVRHAKSYRHKLLDDSLRQRRTVAEASILKKVPDVWSPKLLEQEGDHIVMEYIDGVQLKSVLCDNVEQYAKQLALVLKELHALDIAHGDVTTSNVLVRQGQLVLIDFGLAQHTSRVEDKAVDLYVLERSLATHHDCAEEFFNVFCACYAEKEVLGRLELVRSRGKNKH